MGAQDEPAPTGPFSPSSELTRGRSGDPQRNLLQPVFDPKIVDPREFTFVIGHHSVP